MIYCIILTIILVLLVWILIIDKYNHLELVISVAFILWSWFGISVYMDRNMDNAIMVDQIQIIELQQKKLDNIKTYLEGKPTLSVCQYTEYLLKAEEELLTAELRKINAGINLQALKVNLFFKWKF